MYLPQIKIKDGVVKDMLHFQCLFFYSPQKNGGLEPKKKTLMEFAISMCN